MNEQERNEALKIMKELGTFITLDVDKRMTNKVKHGYCYDLSQMLKALRLEGKAEVVGQQAGDWQIWRIK